MVSRIECNFGVLSSLGLDSTYEPGCEISALEFVNAAPIEWRLVPEVGVPSDWRSGLRTGVHDQLRAFHDLQVPKIGGTRGASAHGVSLETRGFGSAIVFLWLRDGTCRPLRKKLELLQEGCS
jgi:hypothetical protein